MRKTILIVALIFLWGGGAFANSTNVCVDSLLDTNTPQGSCVTTEDSSNPCLSSSDGTADCNLRKALDTLMAASGSHNIYFAVSGTLSIDYKLPHLVHTVSTTALDITFNGPGPGPESLTIDLSSGKFGFRLLQSNFAIDVLKFIGLTIRGAASSAAVEVWEGDHLDIDSCIFENNSRQAIYSSGAQMNISNSIFRNNNAPLYDGGALLISASVSSFITKIDRSIFHNNTGFNGGAIYITNNPKVILNNTMIVGNTAENNYGGGIAIINAPSAEVYLNNTTITGNTAHSGSGPGGGIFYNGGSNQVKMSHSIIAGNNSVQNPQNGFDDCSGLFTTHGYNIIGVAVTASEDSSICRLDAISNDNIGTPTAPADPGFAGIQDGIAMLRLGSPAINIDPNSCVDQQDPPQPLTVDVRGAARSGGCDIGAFEYACGDGIQQFGELCDDGNASDNDRCLNTCVPTTCGDGVVQGVVEECDIGGDQNSDTAPNGCRTSCLNAHCGDDVVDIGEQCDSGVDNSDNNPNVCRTSCRNPFCGDGVTDTGEACDNGVANSDSVSDACRTGCIDPFCGDKVVDAGEGCDDGNASDNDGCFGCKLETCGDGIKQNNEECDKGPANSDVLADECRTRCAVAGCGDEVVDTGEQCDDGNANSSDACLPSCESARCGDGIVFVGNEECDNGELNSDTVMDACRLDCKVAVCGDLVVDSNEKCDDGNRESGDGCSSSCSIEVVLESSDGDSTGSETLPTPSAPGAGSNLPEGGANDTDTTSAGGKAGGKAGGGCSLMVR